MSIRLAHMASQLKRQDQNGIPRDSNRCTYF